MCKRDDARGDQGGRTAGRAAWDAAEIIRIARGARNQRFGRRDQAHFGRRRFAEADHTCFAPGFGKLAITLGDIALKGARAIERLRTAPIEQVFDKCRNTAKGTI